MDQEKIGKFIKEIRKKNNLTQKDLADKYNITYQAVSKWENGKNMPDTSLIKQMSKDFNISLDDIFEGEYSQKNRKRKIIYIIIATLIVIFLVVGGILLLGNNNSDFEFKTLKANCQNFNISGSISYNNSKSAIYISNVSYCGGDDTEEYNSINCTLYEKNNDSNKVIETCNYKENEKVTLEDFLKQVSFTVDNYKNVCKEYSEDSLYLEIEATNDTEKITKYKIPLTLESKCR